MLLTYLTLLSFLLPVAHSRPLAPTEPIKEASTSDNEVETAAPTHGLVGKLHLPASTTPTAAWLPAPDAILLTKDPAPVSGTEQEPDQRVSKFKDYDEYITGPTPSFPMVIEEALAEDHSGERLDSIITSDWSKCETREQVARRLSPEVEIELQRRLQRLGDRYSRLRSHKPLVKHQLKLGTSFLRTALGNVLQDPTDVLFSTGKLDTVRSIPVRFIKALNHVAGETSSVLGYLMAFGYLPKAIKDSARSNLGNIRIGNADSLDSSDLTNQRRENVTPCQVEQAIAEFQSFNGLPVTRQLDVETAHKLRQQRCGIPDIASDTGKRRRRRRRNHSRKKRYVLRKRGWKVKRAKPLTFFIKNCTSTLADEVCRREIVLGFQKWTDVAPIYLEEVDETGAPDADFTFFFVSGEHPKKNTSSPKNDEPFDGPGGVIGHAYFPRGGHIHLDNDETYTADSDDGINLQFIAMHEMGHALGLEHSKEEYSGMTPMFDVDRWGWRNAATLWRDDIDGIQAKYGIGKGYIKTLKPF